jgi:formylmethanofuran dehydrogenase subunit D
LITGRSTSQGLGLELGKHSEKYMRGVASCEFNVDDMRVLGVETDDLVKVCSECGSIVLRVAALEQEVPRGVVFVPNGPWINQIICSKTSGTGMPRYKGIRVKVQPVKDGFVSDLSSLVEADDE